MALFFFCQLSLTPSFQTQIFKWYFENTYIAQQVITNVIL